jgi:hypothetical protein
MGGSKGSIAPGSAAWEFEARGHNSQSERRRDFVGCGVVSSLLISSREQSLGVQCLPNSKDCVASFRSRTSKTMHRDAETPGASTNSPILSDV